LELHSAGNAGTSRAISITPKLSVSSAALAWTADDFAGECSTRFGYGQLMLQIEATSPTQMLSQEVLQQNESAAQI
jgi:hypothetical protein